MLHRLSFLVRLVLWSYAEFSVKIRTLKMILSLFFPPKVLFLKKAGSLSIKVVVNGHFVVFHSTGND